MTKIFVCVAVCVYFVQVCFAAPRILNDHEIQEIRTGLEGVSGMEAKSVESIVDTLKKYRSRPLDLLTIALQGNTCAKDRLDLKGIVETALADTEVVNHNSQTDDVTEDPQTIEITFTDNQLNAVIGELNKYLSPEKVQRARKIFRGFQQTASPDELESGSVELLMSGARGVSYGCPSENSPNNRL